MPAPAGKGPDRRAFLGTVGAALLASRPAHAGEVVESDHGAIKPPRVAPALKLVRQDGVSDTLLGLVEGHVTAAQLMFTSCTTTCPIQGAIFARTQRLLGEQAGHGVQLLSLSVDPDRDTPAVLESWLGRFNARPGWIAAAPQTSDVERLRDFSGRGRTPSDNHSTRIQLFNRRGELVWRTGELPDAEEIASLLRKLSTGG
jgi:protein SCO1